MTQYVCQLKGIDAIAHEKHVLQGFDFTLTPSCFHALVVDNPSSKSALLAILTGVHVPQHGSIYLRGKKMARYDPTIAQREGIQLVGQDMLIPHLSVMENVFLGHQLKLGPFVRFSEQAQRARKAFDALGYPADLQQPAYQLGKAQKRIVEMARVLCSDASIVLLDEVELGLIDIEYEQFFQELIRQKNSGCSIIMFSQKSDTVFRWADQISVINAGQLKLSLSCSELSNPSALSSIIDNNTRRKYPKLKTQIGKEFLRVENLSNKSALRGIDFSIHQGETLGIAGLAGAGRTSLAKCLYGLDPTCRAAFAVQGKPVQIRTPLQALSQRIGLMQENVSDDLVGSLSAIENVTLPSGRNSLFLDHGLEKREGERDLLRFGMRSEQLDVPVKTLSKREQQKVALVKCLYSGAKMLILDEAIGFLDAAAKVELYNVLSDCASRGIAILLISSDASELAGMCDRVLILRGGRVSTQLDGDALNEEDIYRNL